jgi:hypothetical protein
MRDVRQAGFGYRRLLLVHNTPLGWTPTGFAIGAMHLEQGYTGPLVIEDLPLAVRRRARR